jgi:hypothetical protein
LEEAREEEYQEMANQAMVVQAMPISAEVPNVRESRLKDFIIVGLIVVLIKIMFF